ncbi:MAG: hypothetical protein P8L36_00325 [SAR324 cluster bacterium]|jgi:hypothetical protein|nr:hypothetical protein [SAR324 cluster bacterium]
MNEFINNSEPISNEDHDGTFNNELPQRRWHFNHDHHFGSCKKEN